MTDVRPYLYVTALFAASAGVSLLGRYIADKMLDYFSKRHEARMNKLLNEFHTHRLERFRESQINK